jgi:hypothetical protein
MPASGRPVTIFCHVLPASLEMMDALTISAVEAAFHCGYPTDAAAVLLVELDGIADTVAEHGEIYRQLGVRPLINAAGTYTVTFTGNSSFALNCNGYGTKPFSPLMVKLTSLPLTVPLILPE